MLFQMVRVASTVAFLTMSAVWRVSQARIMDHPKLNNMADNSFVEGSYIVVLREDVDTATSNIETGVAKDYIKWRYHHALNGYALRGVTDDVLMSLLEDDSVDFVDEDATGGPGPIEPEEVTEEEADQNITQTEATWGLDRVDQRNLPLDDTFKYTFSGDGVLVFIMDAGVRQTHDEWAGRWVDCVDYTGEGCLPSYHGTHCAGTVLGSTYGVAKKAELYDLKVMNSVTIRGLYSDWIKGLDDVTAMKNANAGKKMVLSGSLGGLKSSSLNAATAKCVAAGVVVVIAAMNENDDACDYSPASTASVITVAATTISDVRSDFSNWGPCVDIFAPGSGITSAWHTSDSATGTISGTSMATPHVAGIAAALLEEGKDPYTEIFNLATPDVVSDTRGSPNLFAFNGYSSSCWESCCRRIRSWMKRTAQAFFEG